MVSGMRPVYDAGVEQRVSLVTLGVSDLARARAFYEGLGWTTGAAPADDVVFFQAGGMILALWSRAQLAEDSVVADGGGWGGVTLAHNIRSPAEVDAVLEEARAAGGTVLRGGRRDLLGRLLRRLRRSRRPPVGGRPQPALDVPRGRLGQPELVPRRARRDQPQQEAEPAAQALRRLAPRCDAARSHRRSLPPQHRGQTPILHGALRDHFARCARGAALARADRRGRGLRPGRRPRRSAAAIGAA